MIRINVNSLNAHQILMNVNANNIANVNTQNFKADDAIIENNLEVKVRKTDKSVDLTKEITDQIVIEDGFKAQISAIKTQDDMTKTLLDIKV
ncbi:flagellar basal body rod C-terminal domain-containing protein [Caminibacter sp.]